jgi:hypothetical protein
MCRNSNMPPLPNHPVTIGSALLFGVVSVLLLHKQISKSIQLFREGFDSKLFWTYWAAFKEKGWEIFWGPTVLGIIFCIFTLWYSPARIWFFAYTLTVVLMTGYYLWRDNYLRLIPKLEFGKIYVVQTPTTNTATGAPGPDRVVAQIVVKCATEVSVHDCAGHLLRIFKWSGMEWIPTEVDEPLSLLWSIIDKPIRTVEPGIDRRLCIFHVDNVPGRYIRSWVEVMIHRMAPMFDAITPDDILRFDIAVSGKECPTINISLKVQMGAEWNNPTITPI